MEDILIELDKLAYELERDDIDYEEFKDTITSGLETLYSMVQELSDKEDQEEKESMEWFHRYTYLITKLGSETDPKKIQALETEINTLMNSK